MIKIAILMYNLLMFSVACYFVYFKDASPWLFLMVLVLAGTWTSQRDNDEKTSTPS